MRTEQDSKANDTAPTPARKVKTCHNCDTALNVILSSISHVNRHFNAPNLISGCTSETDQRVDPAPADGPCMAYTMDKNLFTPIIQYWSEHSL